MLEFKNGVAPLKNVKIYTLSWDAFIYLAIHHIVHFDLSLRRSLDRIVIPLLPPMGWFLFRVDKLLYLIARTYNDGTWLSRCHNFHAYTENDDKKSLSSLQCYIHRWSLIKPFVPTALNYSPTHSHSHWETHCHHLTISLHLFQWKTWVICNSISGMPSSYWLGLAMEI